MWIILQINMYLYHIKKIVPIFYCQSLLITSYQLYILINLAGNTNFKRDRTNLTIKILKKKTQLLILLIHEDKFGMKT